MKATLSTNSKQAERFRIQLLDWYKQHKRDLPWRNHSDLYRVWISEIMLQQTQVNTVIPYYTRWLASFPDIQSLARASEDEVLKLWEGLGYYRRARFLLKGADYIESHGVPSSYAELLQVPGIGPYTAGAIASIVYHEKVPAVDGNVLRVISRFRGIFEPVDTKLGHQTVSFFVQNVLESDFAETSFSPGDFNQAIMELGATICRPKKPRCEICPLHHDCTIEGKGDPTLLPIKLRRTKTKIWSPFAVLHVRDHKVALRKETKKALLQGMWGVELFDEKPPSSTQIAIVRHQFSHRDTYYQVCVTTQDTNDPSFEYFSSEELGEIPVSTAMKKILHSYFFTISSSEERS